jgi:hypothetical protein
MSSYFKKKKVSVKVNNSTETATELSVKTGIIRSSAKSGKTSLQTTWKDGKRHKDAQKLNDENRKNEGIEKIKKLSIEQQQLQYRSDIQKEKLRNLEMEHKRVRISNRKKWEKKNEFSKINKRRTLIGNQFSDSDRQRLNFLNQEIADMNKELNS